MASKPELEFVPLEALRVSPLNVRAEDSSEDETSWAEFKQDIKENGVLQPLLVVKAKEGEGFEVLEGRRRLLALQEVYSNREGKLVAGAPSVPVQVVDVKEAVDQLLLSSSGNLHRLDLTPQEWAGVIGKLKKMGKNQAQIAKLLHKTPAWVSMVKEGKAWSEHRKTSTSESLPPPPREFEDTECPACGNVLSVKLQDGKIVLEAMGKENAKEHKSGKKSKAPEASESE